MDLIVLLEALTCSEIPPSPPVVWDAPADTERYTLDTELALAMVQIQRSVALALYQETVEVCVVHTSQGWAVYVY